MGKKIIAWKSVSLSILIMLIAVTVFAGISKIWVLTAIPIGFLFGFFLERSDLCGSSSFSEVMMMKDARKVGGLWIAIVVSMLLFALGSAAGWIHPNPKPLIWANYLLGGVVFGVGIVLAGGCVSGCLFKAGQGNMNSMAALVAIPIGVSAVAYGPLKGLNKALKTHIIKAADGGPVTLSSLTGLPYWLLALLIGAVTLAVIIILANKKRNRAGEVKNQSQQPPRLERALTRPWKPWHSGVLIGVLALLAYMSSAASGRNYPLGVTHGVLDIMVLSTDYPVSSVWTNQHKSERLIHAGTASGQEGKGLQEKTSQKQSTPAHKHVVWWLVVLVVFLVIGSHISARMRGNFLLSPKPPDETIIAFFGGLLVGSGAALASGCVIGNILSGLALMSVGNVIFALIVVLTNWLTTYFYMMGGFSTGNKSQSY